MGNILTVVLSELGIKFTKSYSQKLYSEHPDKYNLLGLHSMLSSYGVKSQGYKLLNLDEIFQIDTPFIAVKSDSFFLVTKISNNTIQYKTEYGKYTISAANFIEGWSGIILLLTLSRDAKEPDFKIHITEEIFSNMLLVSFFVSVFCFIILSGLYNAAFVSMRRITHLILDFSGIFVCYLLLEKQIHRDSIIGDKICSLFSHKECNNVLHSKASVLFCGISLSEVGFGYFVANYIALSLFPNVFGIVGILNIALIVFSLWSVIYQRIILKQWCLLCLITQVILIFQAILAIVTSVWNTSVQLIECAWLSSVYIFSILGTHYCSELLAKQERLKESTYSLNSIKADKDVFFHYLSKQHYVGVSDSDSHIVFGNKQSKLNITVFSNPHCNPCAEMHEQIEQLLKVRKDYSVRFVFTSHYEYLLDSDKFLIAAFFEKGESAIEIYNRWFKYGKDDRAIFFNDNNISNMNDEHILNELIAHRQWKEKSGITGTPTILVNGYLLPKEYKVSDLVYL